MTPLELFHPRTKGLPWIRSIPGQNDSPGVISFQERMTPPEKFHPRAVTPLGSFHLRIDGLPRSRFTSTETLHQRCSIPGQEDSPGVISPVLTPLESFHPRTEGFPRSRSIPGLKDFSEVTPSQDRKTTLAGVIPLQGRTTPLESFYSRAE